MARGDPRVVTTFEALLLDELKGIRNALDALVMLNVPDESPAIEACEHDWVDLGGESECRKCQQRKS